MEQKKECFYCKENIDIKKDKYTLLGTYSGENIEDESYFHFKCFVEWYNKKVSEKAKNSIRELQNKVQGLISNPQIANVLKGIGGVDKVESMLNFDLVSGKIPNINDMEEEEKTKDNNKNGRTKRKSTGKKKKD